MRPVFRNVALVLVALVVLLCMGMALPVDVLIAVVFGWVPYLFRVVPRVTIDPAGVATGVLCLVLFAGGSHAFLTWLRGEVVGPGAGPWRPPWTAMLVSGIVLMFVSGMAATGVVHQLGWIITSREPMIEGMHGLRSAARRAQSANNLKQIGLAYHNYHNTHDVYPPGALMGDYGVLRHSWQTLILPYTEFAEEVRGIDLGRPWDDPVNTPALRKSINVYLLPGVPETRDSSGLALSHYEGNVWVVGGVRPVRPEEVIDGFSNTILAGESAGGYQPWGKPGHARDPADGINRAADTGFGGPFPGGANVLMMDGSVRFLKDTVRPETLKALATPAGYEWAPDDAF